MKNQWSIIVSDWLGVDSNPTNGSHNLVESSGIFKSVDKISEILKTFCSDSLDIIEIQDNNGNTIHKISNDDADFKNLKSNGKDVTTALLNKTGGASEEIIIGESEDNPTMIVNSNEVRVKKITDLNGNPIGNEETGTIDPNTKRLDTFVGAYNYVISKIYQANPKARIAIVTNFTIEEGSKLSLNNLIKCQKLIAKNWHCILINLADNLGFVNRDGVNVIGPRTLRPETGTMDYVHPNSDYDETTHRSFNVDCIANYCASVLRGVFQDWTGKKAAWFGTSIPDGTYKSSGPAALNDANLRHGKYPIVCIEEILGGICYTYCKDASVMRRYKYGQSSGHWDDNGGNTRHEFCNDDSDYTSVNNGNYAHDYYSGHINYKTHIIDKIGTEEEPDIYILDFGRNDIAEDMNQMKFSVEV